jgi:hypothetical protein
VIHSGGLNLLVHVVVLVVANLQVAALIDDHRIASSSPSFSTTYDHRSSRPRRVPFGPALLGRDARRSSSSFLLPVSQNALHQPGGVQQRLAAGEPRRDSIDQLAERVLPPLRGSALCAAAIRRGVFVLHKQAMLIRAVTALFARQPCQPCGVVMVTSFDRNT